MSPAWPRHARPAQPTPIKAAAEGETKISPLPNAPGRDEVLVSARPRAFCAPTCTSTAGRMFQGRSTHPSRSAASFRPVSASVYLVQNVAVATTVSAETTATAGCASIADRARPCASARSSWRGRDGAPGFARYGASSSGNGDLEERPLEAAAESATLQEPFGTRCRDDEQGPRRAASFAVLGLRRSGCSRSGSRGPRARVVMAADRRRSGSGSPRNGGNAVVTPTKRGHRRLVFHERHDGYVSTPSRICSGRRARSRWFRIARKRAVILFGIPPARSRSTSPSR